MKKFILIGFSALFLSSVCFAEGFMPWADVMKLADTNSDGMVTADEMVMFEFTDKYPGFQPFLATHFRVFDTNGDHMVSLEEFKAESMKLEMTEDDMTKAVNQGSGFMPWDSGS